MTLDSQMIGRRGEKRFDVLCSDAGVTCNRSIEDDYGWDKLIEFPARHVPFATVDMQPGHVIAAVQVKTTGTTARSVSISLSNALRYAKSPMPQFIVLVALDEGEPRYFARHVWSSLIADWLKAGRQADADGIIDIHKRTVSVAFAPEDERGESLLGWIRDEIEAVSAPYAAAKKLIVDTVGFEDGHGTAQFTVSLASPDEFIDLQLGLRAHVEATRFVYTSERFGIRAGKPEIDEENVRLHVTPEGKPCTLRLEFASGGSVTLPATLYGATQGDRFAYRVASRALDTTFGPDGRMRAHAQLLRDDRVTLDELSAFAHLRTTGSESAISLHVGIDDQLFDLGSIKMKGRESVEAWGWLALGLDVLRAIVAECGRRAAELSIGEVDDASGPLHVLSALASDRAVRIDFWPAPTAPAQFDGFLAFASAVIGDEVFSAVAHRPRVVDEVKEGRRRVAFGPARLLWSQIASRSGWSEEAVRTAYQRQLDRHGGSAEIMAVGDLALMVEQGRGDHVLRSDLPTGRDRPRNAPARSSRSPSLRRRR